MKEFRADKYNVDIFYDFQGDVARLSGWIVRLCERWMIKQKDEACLVAFVHL